jgi:hypothetical protein
MRVAKALPVFGVGVWAGMIGAASFIKRALPSRGDELSNDVSLVAVLDGVELESHAEAFAGGSMLAWYGGIDVDLREATLAPGARLAVHALFGGVAIRTPPGWRIESTAKALFGGVDVETSAQDDPEAPVLTIEGLVVFGGIAIGSQGGRPGRS